MHSDTKIWPQLHPRMRIRDDLYLWNTYVLKSYLGRALSFWKCALRIYDVSICGEFCRMSSRSSYFSKCIGNVLATVTLLAIMKTRCQLILKTSLPCNYSHAASASQDGSYVMLRECEGILCT